MGWQAVSRGLDTEQGANVGPISPHVLKKLAKLGIPVEANIREPLQLEKTDLEAAVIVIALDEEEHRPLIARRFAEWADEIVYWYVPDLHLMEAEDALLRIESNVTRLAQELHNPISLSETGK